MYLFVDVPLFNWLKRKRDENDDKDNDEDRSGRQLWLALGRKMGFC
jgi:hypothetical protein